jgi:hypothetical protein
LTSGKLENNKTSNLLATFSHKTAKRPTPPRRTKKQTRKTKRKGKKKTSSLVHKTPTINNKQQRKQEYRPGTPPRTSKIERVGASKVLRKRG